MKFTALSIAAHSTFNHFKALDLLIDCGDSCATHLEIGNVSALRTVLLTHAHVDHVAGLVTLIHLRRRFSTLPPLRILHADPCERLELIDRIAPDAEFVVISPGERIPLGGGERSPYWAVPFPVIHDVGEGDMALGYQLWRRRSRRNPKYAALTGPEMGELARSGAKDLNVQADEHLLTYTGDTRPLDPAVLGYPNCSCTRPRTRGPTWTRRAATTRRSRTRWRLRRRSGRRWRSTICRCATGRYSRRTQSGSFPRGVRVVRPNGEPTEIEIPHS